MAYDTSEKKPARKKGDSKDSVLAEAKECYRHSVEAEADNRQLWLEDIKFGRLGEQWHTEIEQQRRLERRPCLTINRMPSFIRQIANDCRQNKPQIKVKPVDGAADTETAKMLSGLIRNIETASKADIAYDTAVDFAVSAGWGYIRVDVEYSYDDSFDKSLVIKRVDNPLMVYGDPFSTEADSSDWNTSFVVDHLTKDEFEKKYKSADQSDWESGYDRLEDPWKQGKNITVAEYWKRSEYTKNLLLLANGMAVGEDVYAEQQDILGMFPVIKERPIQCYKIKHYILTGREILEENEWAGKYIPIIPVYGEEVNIEGRRYFRSLIRDAKDAQRMYNYFRTQQAEVAALAPKSPWLVEQNSLDIDPAELSKWMTINQVTHPFIMYKGAVPPIRQPLDNGQSIGAMTEALSASDDMKSIMGMFDASLGNKSNETSGRAIMARQREGDVSTFHFIDNLSRAIRHTGCVLIDMIPKVYTGERIVRVLGEDGAATKAKLGPLPQGMQPGAMLPEGIERLYDISTGKYDVAVDTGPGFTTRREEAAMQMTEFIRAAPEAAPIIGDLLVKNLDWPQAEEIAERLKKINPALNEGKILTPEMQKQIQEGKKRLQQLEQENAALKADKQVEMEKLEIEKYEAQTDRLKLGIEVDGQMMDHNVAMMQHEQNKQQPVQVNLADDIGQNVAQAVAPVLADTIAQTIANIPPLQVAMPRMKRTPVRDQNGLIAHTIDEPIDEMVN